LSSKIFPCKAVSFSEKFGIEFADTIRRKALRRKDLRWAGRAGFALSPCVA